METTDIVIDPILPDVVTAPVELVPVYTCGVVDKTKISSLVKHLAQQLPLPEFRHLKRVKKSSDGNWQILISSCELELTELLPAELSGSLGPRVRTNVPRHAPITRAQFTDGSCHWPMSFHEDKKLERKLSHSYFTQAEQEFIVKTMKLAVRLAKLQKTTEGPPRGAVVVNGDGKIVATGNDRRRLHPLQHVTMTTIDAVARQQGGGAWHLPETSLGESEIRNCCTLDEDLQHKQKKFKPEPGSTDEPYLCTGYHIYMTDEPCTMCAMALLHSRISRVFYLRPNTDCGALNSHYKLHCHKALNHQFEVFHVKCTELVNELR